MRLLGRAAATAVQNGAGAALREMQPCFTGRKASSAQQEVCKTVIPCPVPARVSLLLFFTGCQRISCSLFFFLIETKLLFFFT